jgi:glutamate--cysteine ligase
VPANASVTGPPLSEQDATEHVHGISFKTGPPGRTGAELEWLVCDAADPAAPVSHHQVQEIVDGLGNPGALPGGGWLTREPGGQVELSTAPASLTDCVAAGRQDMAALRRALSGERIALAGRGLDPLRRPRRVLEMPRYAAMDEYFARSGPWGRLMMCSTASVQVCVDAGTDSRGTAGYRFRWRLLHALSPVLIAMFANSPLCRGRRTGWKSTRQLVWSRIDPCRTQPPGGPEPARDHADPALAWARYALDAEVMCVRRPDGQPWTAPPGLTFRAWLSGAAERPPTRDDLDYHLSTLFPPVRPRGHLELRVIDAQPGEGWIVPTAIVTALLDDPASADAAMAATEPLWNQPCCGRAGAHAVSVAGAAGARQRGTAHCPEADLWRRAARLAVADRLLATAAARCLEAADAGLGRLNAPALRAVVTSFAERYTLRGRCPADDLTEALT